MSNWKKVKLGDLLEEYCEKNSNKLYPAVAVGKYGIRKREDIYSKELSKNISNNKLIFKDTLTIGMGSNQIDIGILLEDEIYSVSPAYSTFKIKNCNSLFLKYVLEFLNPRLSDKFLIVSARQGKNVDKAGLLNYEIKIPDIKEQLQIVEKINYLVDIIKLLNQKLIHSKQMESICLKSLFSNLSSKNFVYFSSIIKEMADIGSNGSNANVAKHLDMKSEEDYALMVRTSNLSSKDFVSDVKYISKESYEYFGKSKIFGGELIMNKIGSPGKFWMMPFLDRPVSLGLNLFYILTKEGVNIKYIYYFLKSELGQEQIRKNISGGVTQSITKNAVKKFKIYVPDLEKQNDIVTLLDKFEKQQNLLILKIEQMEKLKLGLIHKLLIF